MKKTQVNADEPGSGRILARVLAQDLRTVRGGIGSISAAATPTVTEGSTRDITNVGGDGDAN